ncbi:Panacea domain-containing protein [Thioclava sediminum]|nr:type II toxin-antitoxin system antitoxin SocA domain-containing protein [Thioclava sediminum]
MTTMKLQKLVYYSQAWSTVWDDDVIFDEQIEAWKNGPVVRDLWEATRGRFRVDDIPGGDASKLSDVQADTVKRVIEFYGEKDAQWLSDLTHMEQPWQDAMAQGQNTPIEPASLSEFYSSIAPQV